jgi:nucleoside-diphosphate-sugar epimerase
MASTSSLYAGKPMPFLETADVRQPLSPYAASKLGAEAMAYSYHHLHGLDVSILRYFTVYGPAGRPDMSPFRFTEWISRSEDITIFGDGMQTRSFQYIDDLVEGMIRMMNSSKEFIGPVNIGNPNEFTMLELAGKILTITGSKSKLVFKPLPLDDPKQRQPDISLANKRLDGWKPKVELEQGLIKAINYFKTQL